MKGQYPRRQFLKKASLFTGGVLILPQLPSFAFGTHESASGTHEAADLFTLDASALPPAAGTTGFNMGSATAPGGHTLLLNSRSVLRDGKPWVFISGEFHFSRCPEAEWRDELLKMKAGGVSVVTTYIFWIHHEEVEGFWDWTGRRDLRKFLQTCEETGLDVLLRIGPWCHGEVRNGGFPEWLQKKGDDKLFELRRDDPAYLAYVTKLYGQIDQQTKGMLWKEGGPVIAVQLENEYGGPTQHLVTLKRMAIHAGMDVPLYTCTGWGGGGAAPFGEMVPFSGAYVEGFWDRSLSRMPGAYAGVLRFSGPHHGNAAAMGALGGAPPAAKVPATAALPPTTGVPPPAPETYPFFTCELGAGMMSSYHRRVFIYPEDTESLALVKLGSGANLLGFYMYHGGQNPDGKLGYLNETQATGYWNDLPVKNYDFQAPIGEYGQQRAHYHFLRLLGLFMAAFGPGLSGMTARMPERPMPDTGAPLNWAVRSDGGSGYLFVSHYQRLSPQPDQEKVQFRIRFTGGDVSFPSVPVTIPYNSRFFWPLNLDLGGIQLIYASAQPVTRIDDGAIRYTVFKQTAAISAEFVFDDATATVQSSTGQISTEGSQIHVRDVQPGLDAAIRLLGKDGKEQVILLLDEATALSLWKGEWDGRERLFLTQANLLLDGPALRLRAENSGDLSIAILPAPASMSNGVSNAMSDGSNNVPAKKDGLFQRFSPGMPPPLPLPVVVEQLRSAGPARTIPIAPSVTSRRQGMAMQPEDADFSQAAVWRVKLPAGIDASRDLRLRVRYTGDVIRAYLGDQLIDDDFYNARPFEIGLRHHGPVVYQEGLLLKILPLREDAPISFTNSSKLKFNDGHTALTLDGVELIETLEVSLKAENR